MDLAAGTYNGRQGCWRNQGGDDRGVEDELHRRHSSGYEIGLHWSYWIVKRIKKSAKSLQMTDEKKELFDKMMAGDEQAMNSLIEMLCKDKEVDLSNPFSLVVLYSLFNALRTNLRFVEMLNASLIAGVSIDAISEYFGERFSEIIEKRIKENIQ